MADAAGTQSNSRDAAAPGGNLPTRPSAWSVLFPLALAVIAFGISRLLPSEPPALRADSLMTWTHFGLRILRSTLQAGAILGVALGISAYVPQIGLWLERIVLRSPRRWFLAVTMALAIVSSALFSYFVMAAAAHIQDEIAIVFQARLFAEGKLWAQTPALIDFFDWEYIVVDGDKWYSKYFPAPSLLLVPGVWVGLPWLIDPILAGAAVWLVFAIARSAIGEKVARIAAVLMVISPFRTSLFGMMMAHPVCLVSLALFTLGMIKLVRDPRRWGWAIAAGAGLGFAFHARPLTALAMGAVIGLIGLIRLDWSRFSWKTALAFGVPLTAFAAAFLGYNYALTGDAMLTPFTKWSPKDRLGFGPDVGLEYWRQIDRGLTLRKALFKNGYYNLDTLGLNLIGWGHVTLVLMIWPVLRSPWPRWSMAAALTALSLPFAYIFYHTHSAMLGQARYWSEAMPAMVILVAIALVNLRHRLPHWSRRLGLLPAVRTGRAACWTGALLLTIWTVPTTYENVISECGQLNSNLVPLRTLARERNLENALVFLEAVHFRSKKAQIQGDAYGSGFSLNHPDLDGPVVYARDLGERNRELLEQYPGWTAYRFVYDRIAGEYELVPLEEYMQTATRPGE